MNKRILVISNKESLTWGLEYEMGQKGSVEFITESNGAYAHKSIKETKPAMMIVDLDTPGLVKSWLSIQLEGG